MARTLPSWADEPLDRHQAALTLGISPRTLTDRLKQWPYYERRGRALLLAVLRAYMETLKDE